MTFSSREEAGRALGRHLLRLGVRADLVLGLPRGGVPVAAQVARALDCPLEALVVRKIGHPLHREFAVGALAEPGVVVLDREVLRSHEVDPSELDEVLAEETGRLHEYQGRFHPAGLSPLAGRRVILIDDGLATGATMEAAVLAAKHRHAAGVIVAVPVASTGAVERLSRRADQVIALCTDPDFVAVGQYYDYFPQTTDEEVLELLPAHA